MRWLVIDGRVTYVTCETKHNNRRLDQIDVEHDENECLACLSDRLIDKNIDAVGEGASNRQIANATGLPESTVRSMLHGEEDGSAL